ncbi:TIGR00730 family Rossman fold protein [Bacteroidota bacterium]
MKKLCVFCGSGYGAKPQYINAARELANLLVGEKIGLVYGGAKVGVMGEIAKAVLYAGGEVIGVIPKGLAEKEVAFEELTDLRIVDSMHDRKALMADLSDGFIALPGGLGTIEEFFEVLTWAQLGIHTKPCGLLNTENYYTKLLQFLDHTVDQKFVESEHRNMIVIDDNPSELIKKFKEYIPPETDKARWAIKMTKDMT